MHLGMVQEDGECVLAKSFLWDSGIAMDELPNAPSVNDESRPFMFVNGTTEHLSDT